MDLREKHRSYGSTSRRWRGVRNLISTQVGPTPAAFHALAAAPGQLAWSLHAADAELRKRLVPTAGFEPEVLRDGLAEAVEAHRCESSKDRAVMAAVALLAGVAHAHEHDGPQRRQVTALHRAQPQPQLLADF